MGQVKDMLVRFVYEETEDYLEVTTEVVVETDQSSIFMEFSVSFYDFTYTGKYLIFFLLSILLLEALKRLY